MNFNFQNDLVFEDDRVKLSPLHWDHFAHLLPIILANPDIDKHSPAKFGNESDFTKYFEKALELKEKENRYPFTIFDKKANEYAGSTSYCNIVNDHQRLEIGWTWIGKRFRRTGLNRHCKFLLIQYAFEVLDFERVELKTDARNMLSRNAMEGIGCTYEGALRSHTPMWEGYRRDTAYYSILKEEWPAIKKRVFGNLNT